MVVSAADDTTADTVALEPCLFGNVISEYGQSDILAGNYNNTYTGSVCMRRRHAITETTDRTFTIKITLSAPTLVWLLPAPLHYSSLVGADTQQRGGDKSQQPLSCGC